VILPWTVFGSAYADMRLAPYVIALIPLAIRFREDTHLPTARAIALIGVAVLLIRLAGVTWSMAIAANDQNAKLEALDRLPHGAKVVSLIGRQCGREWAVPRNSHLPGMIMARREGFSNDQWIIEGTNLLTLRYRQPRFFAADPSQIVLPTGCREGGWWIDRALLAWPRDSFDYIWLIDPPPFDQKLVAGLRPVWRGPDSILYQVEP